MTIRREFCNREGGGGAGLRAWTAGNAAFYYRKPIPAGLATTGQGGAKGGTRGVKRGCQAAPLMR